MPKLSFKIAYPIIIAGLFIMVSFIALNYNSLNTSFYIIFVFLVVYVFLFGFATGQNFTRPVRKLLERADNLSKGDLKSRFYLESKDELGQLAGAFNRIADKLEETNTENEKTKRSVGIKVEAETHGLRETINALEQKVQNRTLELQRVMSELEKVKQASKERQSESDALKNQLQQLEDKFTKRPKRKKPVAKTEDEDQILPTNNDSEDEEI